MDLFWGLTKEEVQKMVDDMQDPKYWEKEAARERETNNELAQKYIDVTFDCDALQKRVHRLEAALADLYMEYKGAEKQWEVNWDKQGEYGLMTSLLNGEDVVVPKDGPVRQLYDLLARLNLLECSECVEYCGDVYRPLRFINKEVNGYVWCDEEGRASGGAKAIPSHLFILLRDYARKTENYVVYNDYRAAIAALKKAIAAHEAS